LNNYSIVFACHNALDYTQKCVESLMEKGIPLSRVVAVDNASDDGTQNYLAGLPLGKLIANPTNLGCGVAWNQGALEQQAEWTIIMNNDVLVSKDFANRLISAAQRHQLKIISPAMIEGPLDYDFDNFEENARTCLNNVLRSNVAHAVCMAIHRSVWMEIGYFAPIPNLWGFEDTLFFHHARKANIPMGITGEVWLHHFGSVTQIQLKLERGLSPKASLGSRDNSRKLLNQNWLQRKWDKFKRNRALKQARQKELATFGMSIHADRRNQEFIWR
jgi:glycosyltransferase involved in cell wall biosynthesis